MEKKVKATYCVQWCCAVLSMHGLLCGSENTVTAGITPIPTLYELVKKSVMQAEQVGNLMLQHLKNGDVDVAGMLASQFHGESQTIVQSMYPITLCAAIKAPIINMAPDRHCERTRGNPGDQ